MVGIESIGRISGVRYALSGFVIGLAVLLASSSASAFPSDPETGVSILDLDAVDPGYVLFTPQLGDDSMGTGGVIYLLNVYGQPVHTWAIDSAPGLYAQLLPNGNLLYGSQVERDVVIPAGGGGKLSIIDWDGDEIWSYRNDFLHHDFEMLPDGNIAALIYAKMPPALAEQVEGGLPGTELEDGSMWSDAIIEIDADGNILWQWNAWEYLDPVEDEIHHDINRNEWTHANSMRYVASDPLTNSEAYLVSFRQISTVVLVDRETGEIIWQVGPEILSQQHDARLLDNGNILVFDNGEDPADTPTGHIVPRSRVLEIDPRQDGGAIVWEYTAEGRAEWRFFSSLISGSQRLANGNTLITEGMPGRIFEVTPEKKIVWEYISPYGNLIEDGPSRETWIFKSLKYSPDEIDFPPSLPSPIELLPEDESVSSDVLSAAAPADSDGGRGRDGLEWWHALLIAAGAGAVFFAAGFGVARLAPRG